MPLFKRTHFPPVDPPDSLDPNELVFQVRFTREIFRDYQDYLNHLNLYRQRVWTCKITGKPNLTYEEALVSEQRAAEKAQQFPKELMTTALQIIQFSTLTLQDLITAIYKTLQESTLLKGVELLGKKEQSVYRCKILKVMKDQDIARYEVQWIDPDSKVTGTSVVTADDLVKKKLPFTRDILKSFIRESTSQTSPWVIHEDLAKKYGLSTKLPENFQDRASVQNGCIGGNKSNKRRITAVDGKQDEAPKKKRKAGEIEPIEILAAKKKAKEAEKVVEEIIVYPIDDLLVKPGADDPVFTTRPTPSRKFDVPMECVGDLIMVWDFCSSLSRLLNLWRFPLSDIESALCHKDSNLTLIMESHAAILSLLVNDGRKYYNFVQSRSWYSKKITLANWTEYLCAFLEMKEKLEFVAYITTIKRGFYGLMDIHAKLAILRELVSAALVTHAFREQLSAYIEQRQALNAVKREVAIEEGKKRKEKKQLVKEETDNKNIKNKPIMANGEVILPISEDGFYNSKQNGDVEKEANNRVPTNVNKKILEKSASKTLMAQSRIDSLNQKKEEQEKKDKENRLLQEKREIERRVRITETASSLARKDSLQREIEKQFIRTSPLGKDRNYNIYWYFQREGRVFVESSDSKQWGYYSSKEELDDLMGSLNLKGVRERALHKQFKKYYDRICNVLQKRSREIARKAAMEDDTVRRSTRVRAPRRDNSASSFLDYVNKWKDNSFLMDSNQAE